MESPRRHRSRPARRARSSRSDRAVWRALATTDVGAHQRRARASRLQRVAIVLAPIAILLVLRDLFDPTATFPTPHVPASLMPLAPAMALITVLALVMVVPLLAAGRSPHILYRPDELTMTFDDVRGSETLVEEVTKTLNLFLAHRTFAERMGGSPRKAILFEGPPGTGKTYMAKAMAAEAGVPFLFVSSSAFQSMFYGQTNRKIRAYFKALRHHARQEGGRHRLHRGARRHRRRPGDGPAPRGGRPRGGQRAAHPAPVLRADPARRCGSRAGWSTWSTPGCRRTASCDRPGHVPANILVIGATNRAERPRSGAAPARAASTATSISACPAGPAGGTSSTTTWARRPTTPSSTTRRRRETLAALTAGYSPVMIEHLMDEALVWALRRGDSGLSWNDLQQAKMTEEIGLAQPVEYTEAERRTIATHEAGHATVAWLVGKGRKLEVLTIIKRRDALGLLSHSEEEERFTKTKTEMRALIDIAFGGMVAEELFFGEASTGVAGDLQAATLERVPDDRAARHGRQLGVGGRHGVPGGRDRLEGPLARRRACRGRSRSSARPRSRSPGCSRTTARWSRLCGTRCSNVRS